MTGRDGYCRSLVRITLWNDYICPWAYAARPLTAWLEAEGHDVVVRSYELHPDLPPEGRDIRPGGRLDAVFDHIGEICAESDLPFSKPTRSPNTHRLLGLCEIVQEHSPESFTEFDRELAAIHWIRGGSLDDSETIRAALTTANAPVDQLLELEAEGEGHRLLEASMAAARDFDVTGTPAWRVGELTITGLQPPDVFHRWVRKISSRQA